MDTTGIHEFLMWLHGSGQLQGIGEAIAEGLHTKTRRERIATAVLAGICANAESGIPNEKSGQRDAEIAVAYADALISELDKPKTGAP